TRFSRDWSSDVCSSDLVQRPWPAIVPRPPRGSSRTRIDSSSLPGVADDPRRPRLLVPSLASPFTPHRLVSSSHGCLADVGVRRRSEERRVGNVRGSWLL